MAQEKQIELQSRGVLEPGRYDIRGEKDKYRGAFVLNTQGRYEYTKDPSELFGILHIYGNPYFAYTRVVKVLHTARS